MMSPEEWKMEDLSALLPALAEQGLLPASQDLLLLPGLVGVPVEDLEPQLILEVQVVQMGL